MKTKQSCYISVNETDNSDSSDSEYAPLPAKKSAALEVQGIPQALLFHRLAQVNNDRQFY